VAEREKEEGQEKPTGSARLPTVSRCLRGGQGLPCVPPSLAWRRLLLPPASIGGSDFYGSREVSRAQQ
jgi:hypothetical protein